MLAAVLQRTILLLVAVLQRTILLLAAVPRRTILLLAAVLRRKILSLKKQGRSSPAHTSRGIQIQLLDIVLTLL